MIAAAALACLMTAATAYGVPVEALVAIQAVEGGARGVVAVNSDGSRDRGLMQINSGWDGKLARHWGVSERVVDHVLLNDDCTNAQMGAYVLQGCLKETLRPGRPVSEAFWDGIGCYNARSPAKRIAYARKVAAKARQIYGPGVFRGGSCC